MSTWSSSYFETLPDWSWAGYKQGADIPLPAAPTVTVECDRSGTTDVTLVIQQAIIDVAKRGGGTVYLPAGVYRISPQTKTLWPQPRQYGGVEGNAYSLWIPASGVALRGDGPGKTKLYNADWRMRGKTVIMVKPDMQAGWASVWWPIPNTMQAVTADLAIGATRIPLVNATQFAVGQWVVINCDLTAQWIKQWDMADIWGPGAFMADGRTATQGPTHYAKVVRVEENALTIDVPVMFPMLRRDAVKVYRVLPHLQDVGIRDLSIGMAECPLPGTGRADHDVQGTGAWYANDSDMIRMDHVVDCYISSVATFAPTGNVTQYPGTGQYYQPGGHILSNGIKLILTRSVTIEGCRIERPMYRGGGGNGYLYAIRGAHTLIRNCVAVDGRHNFQAQEIFAVGNVFTKCTSIQHTGSHCDTHRGLAVSQLWDDMTLDGDAIVMMYGQGQTTTRSCVWNVRCDRAHWYHQPPYMEKAICVDCRQIGEGWVVGTSGSVPDVEYLTTDVAKGHPSVPADVVEGVGKGASLEPQSLYAAQLAKRLGTATSPALPPAPKTVEEILADHERRIALLEKRGEQDA